MTLRSKKRQNRIDRLLALEPIRPKTQAERIIAKFGGTARLWHILNDIGHPVSRSTLRRWLYSKDKQGTGGYIPTQMWPIIIKAAIADGLILNEDDFKPNLS